MTSDTQGPPTRSRTTIRRSDELHPSRGLLIGVSLWLTIGIFALYDPVVAWAGSRTPTAYLAVLLFMIPTALSHLELRSWLGRTGSSYRLVKSMERGSLTYLSGWMYALGWAALSALLAMSFANYAAQLIHLITGRFVPETSLVLVLLVTFTAVNLLGRRPSWNVGIALVSLAALAVAFMSFQLAVRGATQSEPTRYGSTPPGVDLYGAIVLLVAAAWMVELTTRHDRRSGYRPGAIALAAGPIMGLLFAVSARWAEPSLPGLVELAGLVSPFTQVAILTIGAAVSAIAWQIIALLMLRSFASMAHDGVFPSVLTRRHARFGTPAALILTQVALTLVLLSPISLLGSGAERTTTLAQVAAIAFLLVQLGVNYAAIILADHPRAEKRSVRLPLYPMVPAVGMAACAVLIIVTKLPAVIAVAVWLLLAVVLYWQSGRHRMRTAQMGVTVFQDTTGRPAVTSDYAVIVPVADPETSKGLVGFGARIARQHGGHVVILNVVVVGEQLPLGAAREEAQRSLAKLTELQAHAETFGVPSEGVSRLARSIGQGISDTIIEEDARLVVVGWHVVERPDGRREFTELLNDVLHSAACNIAMLRGTWSSEVGKILVPVAGGPNAPTAAEIGLSLTADSGGSVTLLNVARPDDTQRQDDGREMVDEVRSGLSDPDRVEALVELAPSPMAGIRSAMREHDALLIGATDPGFFDASSVDQLPIRLAEKIDQPLAVVRGSMGVSRVVARRAWRSLADALPTLLPDEQRDLYRNMHASSQSSTNYFVLISLSAMIATLGLLLNSVAVIIGAMLVAPLMGPIVATAAGIAYGNVRMLKSGALTTLQGSLLAVAIAMFTTLMTPLVVPTSEIMARTNPNLLDLMVALVSGAAGAYIIARKEVGDALPGVAIAAALVPPLCVVGIGAALFSSDIFLGSLLLYSANLAAIVFSSAVVFLLLGVRPPKQLEQEQWLFQGLRISVIVLAIIAIPLAFAFARSVIVGSFTQKTIAVVTQHVESWRRSPTGEEIFYVEVTNLEAQLVGLWDVTVTGVVNTDREITTAQISALERDLDREIRPDVELELFVLEGSVLSGATGAIGAATAAAGTAAVPTQVPSPSPTPHERSIPIDEETPTMEATPTGEMTPTGDAIAPEPTASPRGTSPPEPTPPGATAPPESTEPPDATDEPAETASPAETEPPDATEPSGDGGPPSLLPIPTEPSP